MKILLARSLTLPGVLVIGVSLFFLSKLNAQTTASGAVVGIVADESSAVIVEAEVEMKNEAKGTTQSTRTDREGVYRFFFVAPGAYTLTVHFSTVAGHRYLDFTNVTRR